MCDDDMPVEYQFMCLCICMPISILEPASDLVKAKGDWMQKINK